jgi:hypothetical protein
VVCTDRAKKSALSPCFYTGRLGSVTGILKKQYIAARIQSGP